MEKNKAHNIYTIAVLCIIIVMQCVYTVVTFNKKEVFHSDEIWSYSLSNSYKKPFIYLEPDAYEKTRKAGNAIPIFNTWHDGDYFRNYLVVNENQRFAYDSVIYNQQHDVHPPLYYFLIHTICSFFPETFSWYYAFLPQLLFLAVTQIFLYLLAYELTRRKKLSILVCFMYAYSTMALFTFTFVRQYSMLTMWSVIYTYFLVRMINRGACFKNAVPVMIFALLASLTQYFVLIYIGFATFAVCVYYVIKKRFVDAFTFGFLMCIVVEIYAAVWPAAFISAGLNHASRIYSVASECRYIYELTNMYLLGIPLYGKVASTYMPIFVTIGLITAFILPLVFLFRNEAWFLKLVKYIKLKIKNMLKSVRKTGAAPWILLIAYLLSIIIIAFNSSVIRMGEVSARYTSFIAPVMLAALVSVVCFAFFGMTEKYAKYIICTLVLISCIVMTAVQPKDFILNSYDGPSREEIKAELSNQTVGVFLSSPSRLQYFPEYLMYTDSVYTAMAVQRDKIINKSEKFENKDKMYMLICSNVIDYKSRKAEIAKTHLFINEDMTYKEMEMMGVQFIDDYEEIGKKLGFGKCSEYVRMKNNGFNTVILKLENNGGSKNE